MSVGEIVRSKAGRDEGRYFFVRSIIDDNYVLIVDGDLRKLENPKKKKIKHLEATGQVIKHVKEKLEGYGRISNSEMKKILAVYFTGLEGQM